MGFEPATSGIGISRPVLSVTNAFRTFPEKNQQDLYKSLHYVHYSQSNSTNENLLKLESKTVWHADHLFKAWHALFFQYAQSLLLLMNKQVP